MSGADVVRTIGYMRLVVGSAALVAPRRLSSTWLGSDAAARPETQTLLRSLGARDLLMAWTSLGVAERPSQARRWLVLSAFVDAADAAANLIVRRRLPVAAVSLSTAAMAASALQLWAAYDLRGA